MEPDTPTPTKRKKYFFYFYNCFDQWWADLDLNPDLAIFHKPVGFGFDLSSFQSGAFGFENLLDLEFGFWN